MGGAVRKTCFNKNIPLMEWKAVVAFVLITGGIDALELQHTTS
jgi:hypothetical protein